MTDTLRDALEASFEEENDDDNVVEVQTLDDEVSHGTENDTGAVDTEVIEGVKTPDEDNALATTDGENTAKVDEAQPDTQKSTKPIRAPQSWTPAAREHWDKISPEAQAQITKRETDINKVIKDSTEQRRFSTGFNEMVQPFQGLFASQGLAPLQGIQNVLQTAATLQGGNKVQKAQAAAQLIQDFGIDINALDDLLVGKMPSNDQSDQLAAMQNQLNQQQQYQQNQQNRFQQHQQRQQQVISSETDKFLAENEFAPDLRNVMADFMDMAERQGQKLSLAQAYQRAIGTRPDIQQILGNRQKSVGNANALAGARNAGVSVAQNGSVKSPNPGAMSLRQSLEESWGS